MQTSKEHCKITNSKHQITNKSQIPILNDQNRFGILTLGTRPQGGESKRSADNFGHRYLFDICDLEFLFFEYSSTPKPLDLFTGKTIELLADPEEQVFCD
jgi:hypothetical protein